MLLRPLVLALLLVLVHAQPAPPTLQTVVFKGTARMLLNPERGFRHELDQGCDVGAAADAHWAQTLADMAKYNLTVVQIYCYLVPANETVVPAHLSPTALVKAAEVFARLRTAGVKALLRFAYDRVMPGTHRYSAQTILGHIRQLQPVLAPNIDGLYVLQAGFIGSWVRELHFLVVSTMHWLHETPPPRPTAHSYLHQTSLQLC